MILNIKCYISNMYSIGCEVKTSICRYWAAGKSGAQISMASPVISAWLELCLCDGIANDSTKTETGANPSEVWWWLSFILIYE